MRIAVLVILLPILIVSALAETGPSSSPLDDAKDLIAQGKQKDAIPILEKLVASNSESAPQALDLLARCYDETQKWSKAIECLQQLQSLYPNSVPDGEIKLRLMDYHLADGKFEQYRDLRQELHGDYQGGEWKIYHTSGRRRVLRHEYLEAIPELKKAIELGPVSKSDPQIIDANYRLLHRYAVKKEWEAVEELGPKLIQTYPEIACKFQMEVGKAYQVRKKYEKAIEYLKPAASKCPKDFDNAKRLYKTLLDCYDMSGKVDKAIELGEELVEDYPDEPGYKWELGRAYVYTKQYEKAAPLFEKVMETSSAEWEIRSSQIFFGQCISHLGKGDEALARLDDYYKDKPELWDSYLLAKAAVIFYGPKDDEGCVENLKELLAQVAAGTKSELAYTARELMCKALERTGKWAELARVMENMAEESISLTKLCRAAHNYYKSDNFAEEKRVYKEVLAQDAVSDGIRADCMYGLALCYWEPGLKDAASRLMQKASSDYPRTTAGQESRRLLLIWSQGPG